MTANRIRFEGANAVELKTKRLRLVAVSDFGPRIAFFGKPNGDNLLLWAPGKYKRGDWELFGGHRVWATKPGADENEDTYAPDNEPCQVQLLKHGFRLTGALSPVNHTRRGFAVKMLDDDRLEVDNFLINDGDMLYSGGLWALTCTVPGKGTRYGIPLGDGSEWDSFTLVYFRRWAGHGQGGFADKQIQIKPDMLVIDPRGLENKRALLSHRGIITMSDPSRKVTFTKQITFDTTARYPLNTNMAFYIGPKNFMVEMETMGGEQSLRPGEELHHKEIWTLKSGAAKL